MHYGNQPAHLPMPYDHWIESATQLNLVVAAFNQEEAPLRAQVGAFSVITNLRMDLRFKPY